MSTVTNSNTISLIDADGNERHVRVFGNASDPHFSGKDICQIMDIKDFKQAIQDMVTAPQDQVQQAEFVVGDESGCKQVKEKGPILKKRGTAHRTIGRRAQREKAWKKRRKVHVQDWIAKSNVPDRRTHGNERQDNGRCRKGQINNDVFNAYKALKT
jgi:prophage antirepressor-like protein